MGSNHVDQLPMWGLVKGHTEAQQWKFLEPLLSFILIPDILVNVAHSIRIYEATMSRNKCSTNNLFRAFSSLSLVFSFDFSTFQIKDDIP